VLKYALLRLRLNCMRQGFFSLMLGAKALCFDKRRKPT
jgi:hypothetical protein